VTRSRNPFRSLSSLILIRVINALMQFGTLALIARSVSLADFGGYSASVALGTVTGGLLGFGLSTRVLRIQAESSREVLLSASRVTALSALFVGSASYLYGVVQGSGSWSWALAGGAYVASELFCNLMSSMLFGEQRRRRAEAGMLLRRGLPFLLVTLAALWWPNLVFEFATAGYLVAAVSLRVLVGRLPWGGWRLRLLIRGSWQYWMTSIWSTAQQLDVVIITSLLGLSAAGGYGAAFRLASPIHIVTTSITSLMIPELSKLRDGSARKMAARPYLLLGLGYAGIVIALSPVAAWVGPVLFGNVYAPFAPLFAVLFVNSAFSVVNQIQVARLYGDGEIGVVTWATAVSTIAGLSLLASGAVLGGVLWATIGYTSSRFILLVILSIQSKRLLGRGQEPPGEDSE
jgi:O-antigen/teichoic acid export membrane protein